MEGQDVVDDGRVLDLPSGHVVLGRVDVVGTLRPESLKRSNVTWLCKGVFDFIFLLQSTIMEILASEFLVDNRTIGLKNISFSVKDETFPASFSLFLTFLMFYCTIGKKLVDVRTQTADLWCRKQPLTN